MGETANTHQDTIRKAIKADRTNRTRSILHFFWVGMAMYLIIMVLLGFGSTYGRQLILGHEINGIGVVKTDWVIHLHATVFIGWMVFFLVQTILAASGQTQLHMALGKYGGSILGVAVIGTGILITYMQMQGFVLEGIFSWSEWQGILGATLTAWGSLLVLSLLLGLGLYYRSQPESHKRFMTLTTVALATAATQRMDYLLGFQSIYILESIGVGIMVLPLFVYDFYIEGHIHWATIIGTGILYLFIGIRATRILFG